MIKRNKVVKFALKMRDDYECRDLESLREYFDLEKAIAYFQDGRLITWMKHRGFYDIADELRKCLLRQQIFRRSCAACWRWSIPAKLLMLRILTFIMNG